MLPAPTTRATSTPRSVTSWTWRLIRSTCAGSVPYSSEPIRASPESFRRMRLKAGSGIRPESLFLSHQEAGEACDPDVLAGPRGELGAQLLDRLALVAVGAHVLLVEQRDLLPPLVELAGDDLVDDLVGLALLPRLGLEHLALRLAILRRDLLGGHVVRRRGRAGDVEGHLARELDEVVGARDEVGFALHLHEHADLPGGVDVGGDDALAGDTAASLRGRGLALHPQDLDRLVEVAAGLGQGGLAVHDRGAGALAQGLDVPGADGLGAHDPPSAGFSGAACSELLAASAAAFSASSLARCSSSRLRFSSSSRWRRASSSARRLASASRYAEADSVTASPIAPTTRLHERIASSLPGTG